MARFLSLSVFDSFSHPGIESLGRAVWVFRISHYDNVTMSVGLCLLDYISIQFIPRAISGNSTWEHGVQSGHGPDMFSSACYFVAWAFHVQRADSLFLSTIKIVGHRRWDPLA